MRLITDLLRAINSLERGVSVGENVSYERVVHLLPQHMPSHPFLPAK